MDVNKKKKILFLFAHLHKGGMQRAVSNITKSLKGDYELHVGFFGTENPGYTYNAKMHDFNIPGSLDNSLVNKIIKYFHKIRFLKKFVNVNKFDVVISFGESANLLNILSNHSSKKFLSIRVSINESLGNGLFAILMKLVIYFTYKKADMIIPVSKKLAIDMSKIVGNQVPIYYIPNMYPIEHIRLLADAELPNEYSFLKDENYIVNVGSYCHQKGQDLLVKAYAKSSYVKKNYKLVLVGRGPDKNYLQDIVNQLNISSNIIFVDFQNNPYSFIKNAEAFVLSSRYEGFPNVLMEAMICGVPVISFNCPTGPNEIIDNDINGVLISEISEEGLHVSLESTLQDKQKMSNLKNNLINKVNQYNFSEVSKLWKRIINEN